MTSEMVETTLEGKTLASAINSESIHLLDLTFLAGFEQVSITTPNALTINTHLQIEACYEYGQPKYPLIC